MPKEIDAITRLYDFLLWIMPKLEKFPMRAFSESRVLILRR